VAGAADESRASPLLEARRIEKAFPGALALRGVELAVTGGEVVAVIGENGAGKSTLMKILAGAEQPDRGEILVGGRPRRFRSVHDATAAGVALIHQELRLAGNLDLAANITLGREPRRWGALGRWGGVLDRPAAAATARRYLAEVGLDAPLRTRVGALPIGKRQLVEIARALSQEARVIIFDEPTSSLSLGEAERLFEVIARLRSRGVGVVYISHRLAEVERIADRVVALRDGALAGELPREAISHSAMASLMVGRDLSGLHQRSRPAAGQAAGESGAAGARGEASPALELRGWRMRTFPRAAPISFSVGAGEIVGLAGLVGAGRTELLESLFGVARRLGGEMWVAGQPIRCRSAAAAIGLGLAMAPEDRQRHGLVLEQSIRRNIALPGLGRSVRGGRDRRGWGASRFGFAGEGAERRVALATMERLSIRGGVRRDRQHVRTLSGGNQQKVALGKWLGLSPRVLLLDEPTRGVDIGARAEIYRQMESLAASAQRVAILFASSDMEEILGMSDRVLVMRDGAIAGELRHGGITEDAIMRLATGGAHGA
jgi:ribose transport system ATP-binding protein